MRILVTGGAGFLGTAVVESLAKDKNNKISIFDSYTHGFPKKFPKKRNISAPIAGNIRNYYDIHRAVARSKPEVVFHLAAHVTRPESTGDFRTCAEINYIGTANLMDACIALRQDIPQRIIFASCKATEHPYSHYGITKKASEDLILSLCSGLSMDCTILRFSEIYGHSKSYTSSSQLNFLVDNMLLGNNVAIHGVNTKQDFIHITDAVRACVLTLSVCGDTLPRVDVGNGESVLLKDLIEKIKVLTKYTGKMKYLDDRFIHVQDVVVDPTIAHGVLGFKAQMDLDTGLAELVRKRKRELK